MPQFRLRVELFKGQKSVELNRLASLPEELTKFLQSIADDAGVLPADNQWRASEFKDGSLEFVAQSGSNIPVTVAAKCRKIAGAVLTGNQAVAYRAGATDRTLLSYGNFAKKVQPGEVVRVGVIASPRAKKARVLYAVTAETQQRLTESVQAHVDYHGTVFGLIHTYYVQSDRPHFDLRDIARGQLVKCYIPRERADELHAQLLSALRLRKQYVHVSGMLRASRLEKVVEQVFVDKLETADTFSSEDMDALIGAAPHLTNGKSTAEYIADVRDDE